ncbi:MAG: dTMP kinase [Thermoplasmata archaeon]
MSYFIVFEGIDGSGKSSLIKKLDEDDFYFTYEPTDSEVGKIADRIAGEKTSPYLDMFLYLADRVSHTAEIRDKLNSGSSVICDRYWGSTAAYQAAYDEISLDYAEEIQQPFILEPDITILFDLDPEVALARISGRSSKSKYEKLDFLNNVRDNYLTLAERHSWKVIDAEKTPDEVLSTVKDMIYTGENE